MDMFSDTTGEKYLYRYRPDTVYAIDELLNQYMRFSTKESLNDVFEFTVGMEESFEGLSIQDQNKYVYDFLEANKQLHVIDKNAGAGTAEKLKKDPASDHLEGRAPEILNAIEGILKDVVAEIEKKFQDMAVACFCKKPLNATMMGHYCNNSRGLIISYKRDVLESMFGTKDVLFDVVYADSPYKITPNNFIDLINRKYDQQYRNQFLGRKHSDWIYEDEVRAVQDDNDTLNNILKISSECVAGVCLGSNAPDAFKRVVANTCNLHKIPIFESTKKDMSYDFVVAPLDERKFLDTHS
ncbi:MAG: DUF2971 domain-containing protein [Oleispira sp.]